MPVLLDRTEFERFVPHKGPMFILDRLVAEDLAAGRLEAEVDIHPAARFYRAELPGVPVWVGFEYMAQAIAALSGRMGRLKGEEPRIGFIMGIRDFEAARGHFAEGECLSVQVNQEYRDGPVVSFACRIAVAGDTVVTAIVNAIEVDDSNRAQFMGEGCNG